MCTGHVPYKDQNSTTCAKAHVRTHTHSREEGRKLVDVGEVEDALLGRHRARPGKVREEGALAWCEHESG